MKLRKKLLSYGNSHKKGPFSIIADCNPSLTCALRKIAQKMALDIKNGNPIDKLPAIIIDAPETVVKELAEILATEFQRKLQEHNIKIPDLHLDEHGEVVEGPAETSKKQTLANIITYLLSSSSNCIANCVAWMRAPSQGILGMWSRVLGPIFTNQIYIAFLSSFIKLVGGSSLLARFVIQKSKAPTKPLSNATSPLVAPQFPANIIDLIGEADPTQTPENRFKQGTPLLSLAHGRVLLLNPTEDGEKALNEVITEHARFELGRSKQVMKSQCIVVRPKNSDKSDKITKSSSRYKEFQPKEFVDNKTHNVNKVKDYLQKRFINRPNAPKQLLSQSTIENAVICLKLNNLRLNSDMLIGAKVNEITALNNLMLNSNAIVLCPEVFMAIETVIEYFETTKVVLTPPRFNYLFHRFLTPSVKKSIANRLLKQHRTAPIPHPTAVAHLNELPNHWPTTISHAYRSTGTPEVSPHVSNHKTSQTQFLNLTVREIHEKSSQSSRRQFSNETRWSEYVKIRHQLRDNEEALFKIVPRKTHKTVQALEKEDPFLRLAGNEKHIEALSILADLRIARAKAAKENNAPHSDKPITTLLIDEASADATSAQFSSGKSSLSAAAQQLLANGYREAGIEQPTLVLQRNGDTYTPEFQNRPPGPEPKGLKDLIFKTVKEEWPSLLIHGLSDLSILAVMLTASVEKAKDGDLSTIDYLSDQVFPWVLYFINITLTGIFIGGKNWIDHATNDHSEAVITSQPKAAHPLKVGNRVDNDGNIEDQGIELREIGIDNGEDLSETPTTVTLSPSLTLNQLYGKKTLSPYAPQHSLGSSPIKAADMDHMPAVMAENWHLFDSQMRQTLLKLFSQGYYHLGRDLSDPKIPFTTGLVCLTGNRDSDDLTLINEGSGHIHYIGECSICTEFETEEERVTIEQIMLSKIKDAITLDAPWKNSAINFLLDMLQNKTTLNEGFMLTAVRSIETLIHKIEDAFEDALEKDPSTTEINIDHVAQGLKEWSQDRHEETNSSKATLRELLPSLSSNRSIDEADSSIETGASHA